ncbi:MAG: hypothetical protein P9X26_07500 [Candidatus Stygibacter frigidus]|nr:hypothetical protein [Candidatus Stygibacter frigidus]
MGKKMKMGMILGHPYPPDTRVRSEVLTLLAADHEISLFCIDHDNREKEEILEGISVYRNYFNRNLYKKIFALAYTISAFQLLLRPLIKRFLMEHEFACMGRSLTIIILIILFNLIAWLGREQQYTITNFGINWNKSLRWCLYFFLQC